jgi:hypothetical protein
LQKSTGSVRSKCFVVVVATALHFDLVRSSESSKVE